MQPITLFLMLLSLFSPTKPLIIHIHGDLNLDRIEHTPPGTQYVVDGSIFIKEKINEHASVLLQAGGEIHIGQKIDQHCSVTLRAGTLIEIGEKIDQHCQVEMFVGNGGRVFIGQKVDQHSRAWMTVPNGSIEIVQGTDGESHVHFFCPNFKSAGPNGNSTENSSPGPFREMGFWQQPGPDD
jgi:hypothetical protein